MSSALVLATISITLSGQPYMTTQIRLEPKMCGQSSVAEVAKDGQWMPASARVSCAGVSRHGTRRSAARGAR